MTSSNRPADPDRVVTLPGSHNVRDLGGLVSRDGRAVERGRIFRSDYPGFAEKEEGQAVRALGLRTVADLRRGHEAAYELVAWQDHGVTYERFPLSAGQRTSWHAEYHSYLEVRPDQVVAAVRLLIDPASHPALFHCAAGKDRTGVIAALLLSLLDVDEEQILADYMLTAENLEPVMSRLLASAQYADMLAGPSLEDQTPRPATMRGLLDWLAERGGAEGWLLCQGVEAGEIEAFRAAMLPPT